MWFTSDFEDYELLDTSDGERLERWKDIILIRPDPQVLWKTQRSILFGIRQTQDIYVHQRAEEHGRFSRCRRIC